MAKRVLSIVVGNEFTKICEVSYRKNYKNKGIRVYKSISFPTPKDTIDDGYIRNKHVFSEELRYQLRAGNFKTDKVIFSIQSSKIANREVIIPPVNESRIMDIVRTGAVEYFPIDIKDYILSYSILERKTSDWKERILQKKKSNQTIKEIKKQEKKIIKASRRNRAFPEDIDISIGVNQEEQNNQSIHHRDYQKDNTSRSKDKKVKKYFRLCVYAVPANLIKNYYNFADMMNLDIISIDYSGNSSYQMIKRQANKGTNVYIQLNEQDTLISIVRDDVLILQRTVNYGISSLVEAMVEHHYFNVRDEKEAMEYLKNNKVFLLESDKSDSLQPDTTWLKGEVAVTTEFRKTNQIRSVWQEEADLEAKSNLIDTLSLLTNSIARMLDYYKANNKDFEIESIYLFGTGISIKGIEEFFTKEIGITHKLLDKLVSVSSIKKATAYRQNPSEFITCIGAVINPVDFVPMEFLVRKQKISAIIGATVLTTACLAGAVILSYLSLYDYNVAKEELGAVKKQLAEMPELTGAHVAYENATTQLNDLLTLEGMTYNNNIIINDVIKELERKLLTGTMIHSMVFSNTGVNMNVTVVDNSTGANALVAKMILQLKAIEYFDQVSISGISISEEYGLSKVSFSISCNYKSVTVKTAE